MRLQQHNKILTVNLMYFIFQTLPNDIFSTEQFVLGYDEGATPSTRKLAIFATAVTGT